MNHSAIVGGGDAGSPKVLESVPTEFDYFESSVIQAAIVSEYDRDISPSTIQPNAPIEILIKGDNRLYLDLNNSKLEVECKITNADGTNIAADVDVGPTNLTLHSLFSNVEVLVSGQKISDPNTLYPYRAFFETLLSYDRNVAGTRLLTEGWMKDTTGHFDDFRVDDHGENKGFKERAKTFARSRLVKLMGRLHCDLFHQDKDLPPGSDVTVRLIPSQTEFIIKKPLANAEAHKIRIMSARLWLRTKELSPSLMLAHETMLQHQNIRIPYTKVCMKQITIPTGVTAVEFDNLFTGVLPNRILLGLLADNRMNGVYSSNPFSFEHFNLAYLALKVGGETIPRTAYEPDFGHDNYLREYLGVLDTVGLDIGNKSIDLTPAEWATSYPIFIFRLSPSGLPSFPRSGSTKLCLKFRTPTVQTINGIVFSEFPTILEIDRYRNVILA